MKIKLDNLIKLNAFTDQGKDAKENLSGVIVDGKYIVASNGFVLGLFVDKEQEYGEKVVLNVGKMLSSNPTIKKLLKKSCYLTLDVGKFIVKNSCNQDELILIGFAEDYMLDTAELNWRRVIPQKEDLGQNTACFDPKLLELFALGEKGAGVIVYTNKNTCKSSVVQNQKRDDFMGVIMPIGTQKTFDDIDFFKKEETTNE